MSAASSAGDVVALDAAVLASTTSSRTSPQRASARSRPGSIRGFGPRASAQKVHRPLRSRSRDRTDAVTSIVRDEPIRGRPSGCGRATPSVRSRSSSRPGRRVSRRVRCSATASSPRSRCSTAAGSGARAGADAVVHRDVSRRLHDEAAVVPARRLADPRPCRSGERRTRCARSASSRCRRSAASAPRSR